MDTLATDTSIWKHFFGVSNEIAFQTLVPTGITIFIFVAGLIFTRCREKSKEKKEANTLRKYIYSQIDFFINATKKQLKNNDVFIKQLQEDRIFALEFTLQTDFSPKHILDIKSEDLFDVLVIKKTKEKETEKLDKFNSLISNLDLIEGLRNNFKSSYATTKEYLTKYVYDWNIGFNKIVFLYNNWFTSLTYQGINPLKDSFLLEFFPIFQEYSQAVNRSDMYVDINILINPLLEKARSIRSNKYAAELIESLLVCLSAYENHKSLREYKIKEFQHYKEQLQTIENELKNIKK
jgi:hypothetical protein